MWRLLSLCHNVESRWSLGQTVYMSYGTSIQFLFSSLFSGCKRWKISVSQCVVSEETKASLIHVARQEHLPSLRFFLFLFIWLCQVFVVGILNCSMWDLVPWPGIEPKPPTMGAKSLSHSTTREVPGISLWDDEMFGN